MSGLEMLERLSQEGRSRWVNSQQRMLLEVIDLCRNGYMIRFHIFWKDWYFISLKHLTNGRELIAEWKKNQWLLREGSRILKCSIDPKD